MSSPSTESPSFLTARVEALFERKCDNSYSTTTENIKYFVQLIYLLPAAILQARILWILFWKYKKVYMKQSFYVLFFIDCLICFILVVMDICFARVFQYFPQFCPVLSELVMIWTAHMKSAIFLVILGPFLFIWNVIISHKLPIFTFGGFYIGYERVVLWATMSFFLMILRSITIIITAICTFITVFRMSQLSKRLVSSERTLCIASFLISACFLGTAGAESLFAFSVVRTSSSIQYFLLPISWDILNVGTPIVMVLASRQLRGHVFNIPKRSRSNSKVEDVQIVTTVTV